MSLLYANGDWLHNRHPLVEEAWMEAGACHDSGPSLFFLDKGDNLGVRRAKAVCAGCPVRAECLEYALVHCEKFGVWGGLSERERRRERVRRRREGTLPAHPRPASLSRADLW